MTQIVPSKISAKSYSIRPNEAVSGSGCLALLSVLAAGASTITTLAGNGTQTFAGDGGPAVNAELSIERVAVDGAGNIYIADSYNERIRKIAAGSGIITTIAGTGTCAFSGDNDPATAASLCYPSSIALDGSGNLFITDQYNARVRKLNLATGAITTVAGNGTWGFSGDGGPATAASISAPHGIVVDGAPAMAGPPQPPGSTLPSVSR